MIKLRNYQRVAVKRLLDFLKEKQGNPIVALPTGTGKSVVIADFIKQCVNLKADCKIICLSHVKEIIQQNAIALNMIWKDAPVGIYSAGLNEKEHNQAITYASIGSIYKKAKIFGKIDFIIIDECHLVAPKQNTMYRKFIVKALEQNPNLRIIGFTATYYRQGQGLLTEGEDALFTDIAVNATIKDSLVWFFQQGYLCKLVPRATDTEIDVKNVKTTQGDFNLKELQQVVNKDPLTKRAIEEAIKLSKGRKHWLVFAVGIDHVLATSQIMNNLGIKTTYVHSKMSDNERDANIELFKQGEFQAIVNNGILTTGFDYKEIDLIVMLRPTKSTSLWNQMLGRGTRPVYADGYDLETRQGRLDAIAASTKPNCLVLDFAENTIRLGTMDNPAMPKSKNGTGTAPVKICPDCGTYIHASLMICDVCGFDFGAKNKKKFKAEASNMALISALEKKPVPVKEQYKVDFIQYCLHQKDKPSLRVDYFCQVLSDYKKFSEWICIEHGNYATKKARSWWTKMAGTIPPKTVEEALERQKELKKPIKIEVRTDLQYDKITRHYLAN